MPRGSTNSTTRGMTGRENFDREHNPRDFAHTMARVEGTSGSNAGRRTHPRSSGIRDLGGMTGGRYTHQGPAFRGHRANRSSIRILDEWTGGRSTHTSQAFRGHGARRATAGDVYNSDAWSSSTSSDDDDDDDESDNDTVAGEVNGPRSDIVGEDYASMDCCDLLAGESTRPRHGESRGPRFESTPDRRDLGSSGSRETVFRYADESSDHSTDNATDDASDYRPRGGGRGAGASTRRGRNLHPANHGAQNRRGELSSRRY